MSGALLADISAWQPASIDWKAYVAWSRMGDGVARVILRSSYGVGYEDAHFEAYWQGAIAAGVEMIGVYHYAYPEYNNPTDEADWQRKVVGSRLRPQDWVMLDYEENTPAATASWAYAWLARQEQMMGRLPRLYSYQSFIQSRLQDRRLAAYPLVYALWTDDPSQRPAAPAPWTSYDIVQYSDKATVPGIGTCDANVYLGGEAPMAVPTGWTDDPNSETLTAPNGNHVRYGFRKTILAWPNFDPANLPLSDGEVANQNVDGKGPGTQQDFVQFRLGYTSANEHVFLCSIGQQLKQAQSDLANEQAQVVKLTAQVQQLQTLLSQAPAPSGTAADSAALDELAKALPLLAKALASRAAPSLPAPVGAQTKPLPAVQ